MDDLTKFSVIVIPICWVIGIITCIVFYFAMPVDIKWIWIKSFAVGLLTSLMCLGLMNRFARKMPASPDDNPTYPKTMIIGYMLRLVLAGGVFAAVIVNDGFSVIATLIGYLVVKVVIVIFVIIKKGEVVKEC